MAKTLKDVIKKNIAPASRFGKNPSDPWSVKSNINETAMLDKFLSSRGINPKFAAVDTKDAYAKSNEFKKWLRDHQSGTQMEDMTTSRYAGDARSKDVHSPTAQREKDLEKVSKHHEIKPVHTNSSKVVTMKKPTSEAAHPDEKTTDMLRGRVKGGKPNEFKSYKIRISKEEVEYTTEIAASVMASKLNKDADENRTSIDAEELTTDTLAGRVKGGKANAVLSYKIRLSHAKGEDADTLDVTKEPEDSSFPHREQFEIQEDLIGDTKSATISPADGANGGAESVTKKLSRKAQLILGVVKKRAMKEDMHDWEKEDKSVASYGKKPKFEKQEDKNAENNNGEKKSEAAGTLSGGTTLTGEKRDTVELDPLMRSRPNQPDPTKKKDDKKDDKKDKPKEAPRG